MKGLKCVIGLFTLLAIYGCQTKETRVDDKFHGMWRLDKFEAYNTLANIWTDDTTRIGWNGYILYDGQGHMGVHLTPNGYQDYDTNRNLDSVSHDDLLALTKFYQSNFVYFSDYMLTDGSIEHKRLSATEPKDWGNSLHRDFEFKGDTLILSAKETIKGQKIRLRWIKLK
jgi:hypothetical protein